MRFGLIANLKRIGAVQAINDFIEWANSTNNELILCSELKGISQKDITFMNREEMSSHVDIVVSMGGDGTLLATARSVVSTDIPVLGINLGSLGFLTQLPPSDLIPSLNRIIKGDYKLEKRMLLKTEITNGKKIESPYALNDVVVDNGPVSRIIKIKLSVNGEDVVTYTADGLIISTPTGSTAYSLAVGGPIVHPKLEAVTVAPISSFSLNTRPMILASNDSIEIKTHSEHKQSVLTIDGQVRVTLDNSDIIRITKSDYDVKLIVFPENSYFALLRSKLHWGLSPLSDDKK